MSMIVEYMDLYSKYVSIYGEHTLLLFQVGSFFEVYSFSDQDKYMKDFSNICELKIAVKSSCNKDKDKDKKIYMAGFTDFMIGKYIDKLMYGSNYTVIVYNQIKENGIHKRVKDNIYSPGTYFNISDIDVSNIVTCVWIHKTNKLFGEKYIFGMNSFDIYTGKIMSEECILEYYHNPTSYDEIEKHISIYNPKEVLLVHDIDNTSQISSIIKCIGCINRKVTELYLNGNGSLNIQAKKCENQNYQDATLDKYYPTINKDVLKNILSSKVILYCSLCFLLNYVGQHNVDLISKIQEPIIIDPNKKLTLANHSLKQLNIINNEQVNNSKTSCVLNLLNKCKTTMGKRYFKFLITNPTRDIETLNKSYNLTEHIIDNPFDISNSLINICDIEKNIRKIILKKMRPFDYHNLFTSLGEVNNILSILETDKYIYEYFNCDKIVIEVKKILSDIKSYFNVDILYKLPSVQYEKHVDASLLINKGVNAELDFLIENSLDSNNKLLAIIDYLNEYYNKIDPKCKYNAIKLSENTTTLRKLTITKRRWDNLKNKLKSDDLKSVELEYVSSFHEDNTKKTFTFILEDIESYSSRSTQTSCEIFSPQINKLIKQENSEQSDLQKKIVEVFDEFIVDISSLDKISIFVRDIDVLTTKKEIAVKYNYVKPEIIENEVSYVETTGLRHPLIEHLNKEEMYVPNDINFRKEKGILLFGTNAVGKTSLIRSIGICVIMAQAGLYVPCSSFKFSPYEHIFTRIIGNDNIFKGLSTFAVEMSELRNILKYCNENSLILGDELCSGTEIDSALSIFVTAIKYFNKIKSSFIFATHFHQITKYEEIKDMENLVMKHLAVVYNKELDTLIYDRKLKDGSGESIYGLEVCKSLALPQEFIDEAYNIRNKYNNDNILNLKKSKYNKDKIRGMCEFCNEELGTEIHHNIYQMDFKNNDINKNHSANLSSICEKCHDKIHKLGLRYIKKKTIEGKTKLIKSEK